MKKPEKSLLIRIAKHIVKDEPNISDKEIRVYFQRILEDLPHGDLHERLIQHKKKHAQYLVREVRRLNKQRADVAPQNGVTENGTAPSDTAAAEEETAAAGTSGEAEDEGGAGAAPSSSLLFDIGVRGNHILQSEKYDDTTEKRISQLWSQIPKNALGPECAGLDQHCLMLVMTDASSSPRSLYNILHHCYICLAKDLSGIRERNSAKSARKKLQSVDKFLRMFLLRRSQFTEEITEFPSVVDLLMAVVSMYLDLFILAHRGREVAGKQQQQERRGVVTQVMAGPGEKALDVLLQMTSEVPDAAYLCPLIRYVLREKPGKRSHSHYLRYVLTVCMWKHLWADLTDVVAAARMLRAPKGFVSWLKQWSPGLGDQLPSLLPLKGLKVTAFLLDDADRSVIDLLLKALATYEKGKADGDDDSGGDQLQHEEGTQQGKSEKAGRRKKSKKKKKKLSMAGEEEEEEGSHRKTANQSVSVDANDEASDASGDEEEDADLPEPTPPVEVFDLTHLGEEELSGVSAKVSSGDLFMIDRGRKRSADTLNSDSAEVPKKKKKKKTKKAAGREPSPAVAPESENGAFFIDRGQKKKKVELQESDSMSKKPKKRKSWKLGNNNNDDDNGEDEPSAAEPEQEAAALPSPAQSAPGEEPSMNKKKKKRKGSVQSSPASAAVSKPVVEEGGAAGFFIDRGEKTVSSVTREEPKRKRKKVSESKGESPVVGLDASGEEGDPHTTAAPRVSSREKTSDHSVTSFHVPSENRRRTSESSSQEPSSRPKKQATSERSASEQGLSAKKRSSDATKFTAMSPGSHTSGVKSPLTSPGSRTSGVKSPLTSPGSQTSGVKSPLTSPGSRSMLEMAQEVSTGLDQWSGGSGSSSSLVKGSVAPSGQTGLDPAQPGAAESCQPTNDSIVPDSFSEMDTESDVVMVPDLRVHLKAPQSPGLSTSQEDLGSKTKSPVRVPGDKAAGTPESGSRSPLSPTFSPGKMEKAPRPKRKPRDRASLSAEEVKGSSDPVEEQDSEEAPRKSRSPTRQAEKRKSSVEGERRSSVEAVRKTLAATKKSPSETGRRKSSENSVPEIQSSVSGAKAESAEEADRSKRAAGKAKARKSSVNKAEAEADRKQAQSAGTPQEEPSEPKKRTPKSTTPVSRRTRSQRKPTRPQTAKSPQAAETEAQPADNAAHTVSAKPCVRARSGETASPQPTSSKKSREAAASVALPDPDTAKPGTALRSRVPRSSKAEEASVIQPEPTPTSKRKSVPSKSAGDVNATLQTRATRKSKGPQDKSSSSAETHTWPTGKPPGEEEAGFTQLKPVPTSPACAAGRSRQAAPAEGAHSTDTADESSAGKAAAQQAGAGKTSPLKKNASLATETAGSPDRQTRSQSHSKRYNLRKSIKQDQ